MKSKDDQDPIRQKYNAELKEMLMVGMVILGAIAIGILALWGMTQSLASSPTQQYYQSLNAQERGWIKEYRECLNRRVGYPGIGGTNSPLRQLAQGDLTWADLAETASNLGCDITIPAGPK